MERWVAKLISLFAVFLATLGATLLPIKIAKYFIRGGIWGQRFLSYFICLGGGVFFSIYMLHMSPEVHTILNATLIEPNDITYPVAELIISTGFFLMVFLERLVMKANKRQKATESYIMEKTINGENTAYKSEVCEYVGLKLACATVEDGPKGSRPISTYSGFKIAHDLDKNNAEDFKNTQSKNEDVHEDVHAIKHDHDHDELHGTRSLILLLALSTHHLFEGISVGLKHSETAVWNMSIAIISHELVIGFSLGLQLVKVYSNTRRVVTAGVICSLVLPTGQAIGMIITETGKEETSGLQITNGILQGLATGVFIYVTFFEILYEELGGHDTSLGKLLAVFVGFVLMALLGLIQEDPDSIAQSGKITGENNTLSCVCN